MSDPFRTIEEALQARLGMQGYGRLRDALARAAKRKGKQRKRTSHPTESASS